MENILIVEDSETTRCLIRAVIEEIRDFNIIEAASGFEALKILPQEKFNLIITDINMPEINGLELIRFVKTNPLYKDIPLIIVTTERGEEDRKKGMSLGASAYITKPFKADELKEAIKRVLNI
ncbi:MAG: response regulator [Thermodesulfovibrionales bacterium]